MLLCSTYAPPRLAFRLLARQPVPVFPDSDAHPPVLDERVSEIYPADLHSLRAPAWQDRSPTYPRLRTCSVLTCGTKIP